MENPSAGSNQYHSVLQEAKDNLDLAVQGLRESGRSDYLPLGLLARAKLHQVTRDRESAQRDLDEAREIAERGEMTLVLADCHLEATRLCLVEGKPDDARGHLDKAAQIVNETGYGRRRAEIAVLEGMV
jgi:hypothetical protein